MNRTLLFFALLSFVGTVADAQQGYLSTPTSRAELNDMTVDAFSSSVSVDSSDFVCRASTPASERVTITAGTDLNMAWSTDESVTSGTCRVYLSDNTETDMGSQHFLRIAEIPNCHETSLANITIPETTLACTECILRWEFVGTDTYFSNCVDVTIASNYTGDTTDFVWVTVNEMLQMEPDYYGVDADDNGDASNTADTNGEEESIGASAGIIAGLLGISCLLGMLFAFAWSRIFGMNVRHEEMSVSQVEAYPSGAPKISRRPEIPQEDRFPAVVSIDIDSRFSPFALSQGA